MRRPGHAPFWRDECAITSRAVCSIFLDQIFFDDDPPPAPPAELTNSLARNDQIAADSLAFQQRQYDDGAARRAWELENAQRVSNDALATSAQQREISGDYYQRYKDVFAPLENQMVAEARAYDTPERREAEAGRTAADIGSAYSKVRGQNEREMLASGVDPSSQRYAGLRTQMGANEAADTAAGMNAARRSVEDRGYARQVNAASLGRNLPANQSASAQLRLSAGNTAMGATQVPGQSSRADAQTYTSGYSPAISANNSTANIASGLYNQALAGYGQYTAGKGDQYNLIGQGIGAIGSMFAMSSAKRKTNKRPMPGGNGKESKGGKRDGAGKAMAGLRDLKVEKYQYKDRRDEPRHLNYVSPYAEDFSRKFGVGDGKTINLHNELGVMMLALKDADRRIAKLEKRG